MCDAFYAATSSENNISFIIRFGFKPGLSILPSVHVCKYIPSSAVPKIMFKKQRKKDVKECRGWTHNVH